MAKHYMCFMSIVKFVTIFFCQMTIVCQDYWLYQSAQLPDWESNGIILITARPGNALLIFDATAQLTMT